MTVLTADEGKVLRRIASGEIIGKELWLGYSYYIGGVLQNPPHLDTQADFDEIDEPEPEEETIPEPEEEDIPDDEALRIITGQEQ
ncbi:MAG: hypothetical protein J5658_03765 [Prevotella sp.]|nr:hypothetical protein [Prevotella sp.]